MLYLDTNHFDNHCTCKCMLSQPFALKGKSLTNSVSASGRHQLHLTSMLIKLNLYGLVLSSSRCSILLFSLNSSHSYIYRQVSGIWVLPFIAHLPLLNFANLMRSSYFHFIRLMGIHRSVSSSTFFILIHAFICSRINCCNSLLIGLPKTRLSPTQLVLRTDTILITRFPRYSHISI